MWWNQSFQNFNGPVWNNIFHRLLKIYQAGMIALKRSFLKLLLKLQQCNYCRWLQKNEVGMLPSKINYLHQRALRGQKWTKRCHSPIRAWKIFFSFLLGIRKWALQGPFFQFTRSYKKLSPLCTYAQEPSFFYYGKKNPIPSNYRIG